MLAFSDAAKAAFVAMCTGFIVGHVRAFMHTHHLRTHARTHTPFAHLRAQNGGRAAVYKQDPHLSTNAHDQRDRGRAVQRTPPYTA